MEGSLRQAEQHYLEAGDCIVLYRVALYCIVLY